MKERRRQLDPEYNCKDCYFQGTEKAELDNHVALKHRVNSNKEGHIKCRNCNESFVTKTHLMNHRKKEHASNVALCRNKINGNCPFTANLGWWSHAENVDMHIDCYVCGESFESRPNMMMHRKIHHSVIVKKCNLYEAQSCRFDSDSCWFKHEGNIEEDEARNSTKENNESVFQNISKKKEPPIKKQ